jgi:hypothetical protein
VSIGCGAPGLCGLHKNGCKKSRILPPVPPIPCLFKQVQGLIVMIARENQAHLNRICVSGAIEVTRIISERVRQPEQPTARLDKVRIRFWKGTNATGAMR